MLNLDTNQISDIGVAKLAEILRSTPLQELGLADNELLTNACLKPLAESLKKHPFPNIFSLDLSEIFNITKEEIDNQFKGYDKFFNKFIIHGGREDDLEQKRKFELIQTQRFVDSNEPEKKR